MDKVVTDKVVNCFYETSEDCVKVVDTTGVLKSFNSGGLKVMEIDNPSDVLGKSWLDFWKGDLRPLAQEAFDIAVNGEPAMFEGICPTLKGNIKHWTVSLVPMLADDGTVSSILVTSKDVTKLVELEKRVEKLEAEASK
jgi:PAS domain S-box-containing protein